VLKLQRSRKFRGSKKLRRTSEKLSLLFLRGLFRRKAISQAWLR